MPLRTMWGTEADRSEAIVRDIMAKLFPPAFGQIDWRTITGSLASLDALVRTGQPGLSNGSDLAAGAGTPTLTERNNGTFEVAFASGCTQLYGKAGSRIQAGASCSQAEFVAGRIAIDAYFKEQGI